ncbi:hypothetical protein AAG570_008186 [Ranatra chinensis]|uniref:Reverse transcriptase domain-containing protein n=1 Tax=Ranatra chinensis TaxID=642074 RepID=A0ABD0XSF7_9HEMI
MRPALKTVAVTFQSLMDQFLDPNAIQVYTDDIVLFSKSEYSRHLGQLLGRLKEFGLRASFFRPEIRFIGNTVSARGVAANNDKVAAVKELSVPKDPKEVNETRVPRVMASGGDQPPE